MNKYGVFKMLMFVVLGYAVLTSAEVRLPSIISDHMVLLKAEQVPVWGRADAGEEVSVTLNGQTVTTTAGSDGAWRVDLDLDNSPPGPFEMTVSGTDTAIVIQDVVVGEVWLGSGQSNAGLEMSKIIDYAGEIATVTNLMHREFMTIQTPSLFDERDDVPGFWRMVEPGSTRNFSAIGYFFIKSLHNELNVPVGYINNCWGGIRLDRYLNPEAIASVPRLAEQLATEKQNTISSFDALRTWLQETGRADREPENLEAFTQGPFTQENGWEKGEWINRKDLVLPGGEPENGVFWIAAEVDGDLSEWPSPKRLLVCNNGLFEKVYWNGELIGEVSDHNYTGTGTRWHYYIRPEQVREGANYLAIRFYAPIDTAGFGWWPGLDNKALVWRMKKEYGLAPLAEVQPPPVLNTRNVGTGSLFNGMLRPIIPYAIRGAVWYQGESNTGTASAYHEELSLLINGWRGHWEQDRLPFYFYQLPQYRDKTSDPGAASTWAELREAQLTTLSVPDTGMAVLIDTGESKDIHPLAKDIAGERMAKIALANVYGKDIPYSGPVYESMSVEGSRIRLNFSQIEGGLVAQELPAEYDVRRTTGETAPLVRNSPGSELEGFAVRGADMQWFWADDAHIDGETVLVSSIHVPNPLAVRYGWADNPTCNLYNQAGLPASPFRDEVPAPLVSSSFVFSLIGKGPASVSIVFDGTNANSLADGKPQVNVGVTGFQTIAPGETYTQSLPCSTTAPKIAPGLPSVNYTGQPIYAGHYVMWTNNTAGTVTNSTTAMSYRNTAVESLCFLNGTLTTIQRQSNFVVLFEHKTSGNYGFDTAGTLTASLSSWTPVGEVTNRWVVIAGGTTYVSESQVGGLAKSSGAGTLMTLDNPAGINWAAWNPGADMSFGNLEFDVPGYTLENITHAGYAENAYLASGTLSRNVYVWGFRCDLMLQQ